MIGFGLGLVKGLAHQGFSLAGFAIIAFEYIEDFLFFFLDVVLKIFQLGLKAHHLWEIWTILSQGIGVVRRRFASLLQQIGERDVALDLGHGIKVSGFGELV